MKIKIKSNTRSGNTVSKSERKVKRLYKSNIQKFSFFCNSINQKINIIGPSNLIRKIMLFGSIERYLIHCKSIPKSMKEIRLKLIKEFENKKNKENTKQNLQNKLVL